MVDESKSVREGREKNISIILTISSVILIFSVIGLIFQYFSTVNGVPVKEELLELYNDLLYFLFFNSIILSITLFILKSKKYHYFKEWNRVFFECHDNKDKEKIQTLFLGVYLPVIFYILLKILIPKNSILSRFNDLSIFGFWGIWMTSLSFIVATKVYFEVQKSKTKTLTQYLEKAIETLEKLQIDHELVFIAPTLYVGAMEIETKELAKEFRDLLKKKSEELKKGKITIAILNAELPDKSKPFPHEYKDKDNNEIEEIFRNNLSIPYFEYHNYFRIQEVNKTGMNLKSDWYIQFFKFLEMIHTQEKIHVVQLKNDKNSIYQKNKNKECGYFCIANYMTGFLYSGEYVVEEVGHVPFYGSYFEDQNVIKMQKKMIQQLIQDNKV